MSILKLGENITFLRKQKGITQDELAQVFNVTNQSVSKWESGASCPDISLLPDIATYFGVSTDELLGYTPTYSFSDVVLRIKSLLEKTEKSDTFDISYKLAFLSVMGVLTNRFQWNVTWDTINRYLSDDNNRWVYSVCSEPEGNAVAVENSIFICNNKRRAKLTNADIRNVYNAIQNLADKNNLKVLFALYELTVDNFDLFVSKEEISEKCGLSVDAIEQALDKLPIQLCPSDKNYRIDGPCMHFVPMLLMFRER